MEHLTAELAVGDRLKADLLLLPDHRRDRHIFDLAQLLHGDLAAGAARPGFQHCARPEQRPYVVRPVRRPAVTRHDEVLPSAAERLQRTCPGSW